MNQVKKYFFVMNLSSEVLAVGHLQVVSQHTFICPILY